MDILTVTNQKGGIGKSTTAHALGAGFSLKGFNVLLIDLDPQSNLTIATGADRTGAGSYEILTGAATLKEVIKPVKDNLDIVTGSNRLSRISQELTRTGKEYKLKEALEGIRGWYDVVIIDTPPALGELTVNALTAAGRVVIPAQAELFSLEAIKELADTISVINKYTNPGLKVEGVVLTRYQPRSILAQEMTEMIEGLTEILKTRLFNARIREAVAIKEAQAMRQDIFTYAPHSKVARDYMELLNELAQPLKKGGKK